MSNKFRLSTTTVSIVKEPYGKTNDDSYLNSWHLPEYHEAAGNYPCYSSAALEELSKEKQAEEESDALYLSGEVTEYSNKESDSETDMEKNRIHEEL
ncbi:hypothetical protein AVEN_62972-1 [Araneus ventricosus]|uniref:Uncharacterized protein n=1 Tax=Araneus ventricosus TaxID=182803 RepID=A0A4Y2KIR0_ARAVE|nr:hypothetical protein AVEN_62972-1 [Araneus ventricosus]